MERRAPENTGQVAKGGRSIHPLVQDELRRLGQLTMPASRLPQAAEALDGLSRPSIGAANRRVGQLGEDILLRQPQSRPVHQPQQLPVELSGAARAEST